MSDPVVLMSGLQSDGSSWMPLLQELWHCHAFCVPMGHQFDEKITDMAKRALDQSPERFHLVGWSMGGYIAFEMLRLAPERLRSLALISTTAAPESAENLPNRQDVLIHAQQEGIRDYQDVSMKKSVYEYDKIDPAQITRLIDAADMLGVRALQQQTKAIIARPDSRPDLAASSLPVFILAGCEDQIISVSHAREMYSLRPDACYHELADCGHCPPLEYPVTVARLLGRWLLDQTEKTTAVASKERGI